MKHVKHLYATCETYHDQHVKHMHTTNETFHCNMVMVYETLLLQYT
jgi:hypothetical protein